MGVQPESIPGYLAVVGDSAHGFPGLPGWGEKAAAAMLFERWDEALLYRTQTTLRVDAPTIADVDELRWTIRGRSSRHGRGHVRAAAVS